MNFKKILSAVGLLTVAVPASLSMVACSGPGPKVDSSKTDIVPLIPVKQVNGTDANTEATVLAKIIELNSSSKLTNQDIEIKAGTFKAATAGVAGSATIAAKANSSYTGEVAITIAALPSGENLI